MPFVYLLAYVACVLFILPTFNSLFGREGGLRWVQCLHTHSTLMVVEGRLLFPPCSLPTPTCLPLYLLPTPYLQCPCTILEVLHYLPFTARCWLKLLLYWRSVCWRIGVRTFAAARHAFLYVRRRSWLAGVRPGVLAIIGAGAG